MKNESITNVIEASRKLCINRQSKDTTGHSHHHSFRVYDTAVSLQSKEGGDLLVVQLAALLHDINDRKLLENSIEPINLTTFLTDNKVPIEIAERVVSVINNISFMGALVEQEISDLETAVVMDADRLDAMGAIGIARAFAYGGATGRDIFNPDEQPELHSSKESYYANRHCTINHFHEKLLLLKDRMNTNTGKQIAEDRHNYMVEFLKQFHAELEGAR